MTAANARFCIRSRISRNSHWIDLKFSLVCLMTSVNAYAFSYFSSFNFFTFFLFSHLPHLRLAKHAMTAKKADKHAQIENMMNHSIPWDVIQKKVGCGKTMIRRISRKTKMQSKNSAGRHRLLTPTSDCCRIYPIKYLLFV